MLEPKCVLSMAQRTDHFSNANSKAKERENNDHVDDDTRTPGDARSHHGRPRYEHFANNKGQRSERCQLHDAIHSSINRSIPKLEYSD